MAEPVTFETFVPSGAYAIRSLRQGEPSCFNGDVRVERYRVTVTKIDESKEVLQARLQDLWERSSNHHHSQWLRNKARRLGVTLSGARGAKAATR